MIRWGIIGCGDVCEIKSGPGFYKCENSALVAVMRRNLIKAKDFAERHQVPKYYSDADDLINDPDVDIIYIATPPESHAKLAIQAIKAGKPVYVEKPMAVNYEECRKMIDVAQKYNQKLFVAYYRRSLPYFQKIKELLENQFIGKPQIVKIEFLRAPLSSDLHPETQTWRLKKEVAGGGYFYDTASHTIDILMFLLGNIIKANGIIGNTGGLYPIEDTVSASLLFDSGIIGSGIWMFTSAKEQQKDQVTIIGEKGSIAFSVFSFSDIQLKIGNEIKTYSYSRPEHIQMDMIQSIVYELENKGISPSTGETAALTNWVMEQIFQNK